MEGGDERKNERGVTGIYWERERTNDVRRGKRALEDKKQGMSHRPIASIGCQHLLLPGQSCSLSAPRQVHCGRVADLICPPGAQLRAQ